MAHSVKSVNNAAESILNFLNLVILDLLTPYSRELQ